MCTHMSVHTPYNVYPHSMSSFDSGKETKQTILSELDMCVHPYLFQYPNCAGTLSLQILA